MIIDTLENLGKYAAMNPLFEQVVAYFAVNPPAVNEPGRVEIGGADLVVNYNIAQGKTPEQARLETHDRMTDIQIPLEPETFGYTPRAHLPEAAYDPAADMTLYDGAAELYFTLQPGQFAIFFPQDGHAPAISEQPTIKKIIVKVANP